MSDNTAFWGMVINNYDETDLALVQQGYPDYIRQLVYTLEVGTEKETPHIQAYIKLNRQMRLSYVRKLFPRGSFKPLIAEEYKLNAQRYAQKLDKTADSPAVITNNPFPDPVVELTEVIESAMKNFLDGEPENYKEKDMMFAIQQEEQQRVREKPRLAKFYVSATYKQVKKQFWRSIVLHIVDTHTHTHSDEKLSHVGGITDGEDNESGGDSQESGSEDSEGEGNEDSEGSSYEGHSESSGNQSDEEAYREGD